MARTSAAGWPLTRTQEMLAVHLDLDQVDANTLTDLQNVHSD